MKKLLILFIPSTSCWAQTDVSVKSPKPQIKDFKTYEEWIESLTDWKMNRRTFGPAAPRFQIVNPNPGMRADTFLLDTETGKVWVRTQITDVKGAQDVWLAQDKIDNDQEFAIWYAKQTAKVPVQTSK
jgi:hypothetical protein